MNEPTSLEANGSPKLDPEEAWGRYRELMQGKPYVPKPLRDALKVARARQAAATKALAAADADVAHKQSIAAEHRDRLERSEVAIQTNSDIALAEHLAHTRRVTDAQLTAAKNMLRKSTEAQTLARAEAQAAENRVQDIKAQIHQAHLGDLVVTLEGLRSQEHEICCLLGAARLRGTTTRAAEAALDAPPPRPTSQITLPHPGIALDINTPIGGDARALETAQRYWRERDAELERDDDNTTNQERAA